MIFMNTLRMVVDLSFYFFFAEFVVASFGGNSMLKEMLLLCLCYGILAHIQKFSRNRIFWLLPVLVLFLPESGRIALVPPIVYILYLIYKEEYGFSWERQAELFLISWKIFLGAGICLCMAGRYQLVLSHSLPMALISLFASVLFLRMLRHDPEVYLNRQYQTKNILLLGSVLMAAWLSSREIVFQSIWSACNFIYMNCILPIFSLLITCVVAIIGLFMKLFSWLKFGKLTYKGSEVNSSGEMNMFSDLEQNITNSTIMFEQVVTAIIIIVLVIAAFFFFRWLASGWETDEVRAHGLDIIRSENSKNDTKKRDYATSTVHQVRRQYRKFLKLYMTHGERILSSDTSADIAEKGGKIFPTPDMMDEMREIYIRARYNNDATRADLKKMKQINQLLKQ